MCQILVSTVMTTGVGRYRHGDIITVLPDDHVFTALERSEPKWQIVSMPGLSVDALNNFAMSGSAGKRRRLVINMDGAANSLLSGGAPAVTLSARQTVALFSAAEER